LNVVPGWYRAGLAIISTPASHAGKQQTSNLFCSQHVRHKP